MLSLAALFHAGACTSADERTSASNGAGGRTGANPATTGGANAAGASDGATDAGLPSGGGTPNTTSNDVKGGAAGSDSPGGAAPTAGTAGFSSKGGTGQTAGSAGIGAGGVPPVVVCKAPKEVSTAEEVVAAVVALGSSWSVTTVHFSKVDAITDDLLPTVNITVLAADIPPPSNSCGPWGGAAGACGAKFYGPGDSVLTGSDTLQLTAGSAIRLRPYIMDLHPVGGFIALVAVLPPCSEPCPEGAWRCPIDRVCYPKGEAYCLRCDKLSPEICACKLPVEGFTFVGAPPDSCDYFMNADMVYTGTCQNGICKR